MPCRLFFCHRFFLPPAGFLFAVSGGFPNFGRFGGGLACISAGFAAGKNFCKMVGTGKDGRACRAEFAGGRGHGKAGGPGKEGPGRSPREERECPGCTEDTRVPVVSREVECHPWQPFLPEGARLLLLGSFPPRASRWSMDFFYPNWNNDMWRVWGLLYRGNKDYFACPGKKKFDREKIEAFCREKGIAVHDTAEAVVRLKGNASDAFLEVVRPVDVGKLLARLPDCRSVVATGKKAAEALQEQMELPALEVGGCCQTEFEGRRIAVWRMPSTSRAYPRSLEWKASYYRKIWEGVSSADAV